MGGRSSQPAKFRECGDVCHLEGGRLVQAFSVGGAISCALLVGKYHLIATVSRLRVGLT